AGQLPPGEPGASFSRAARWMRGHWRSKGQFLKDFRSCQNALASARRAGTFAVPFAWTPRHVEDGDSRHFAEGPEAEVDSALRELDEIHPGLQLVGKYLWGSTAMPPALLVIGQGLLERRLRDAAGPEGEWEDVPLPISEEEADLAGVINALI